MWRAIHWLCATKSVTTEVWGGTRRPRATREDIAVAGVACVVTTASGQSDSRSAASRRAPRRVTPRARGESLAIQSPSADPILQSKGARRSNPEQDGRHG